MNTRLSPFCIEEKASPIRTAVVRNRVTGESYSFIPESGGRLAELWLSNGEQPVSLLKKIEDPASRERDALFANAKLSPFAGRIRKGRYALRRRQYALPTNYAEEDNACHGLVYDQPFDLVRTKLDAGEATCTLRHEYKGKLPGYPFPFTLDIAYTLTADDGLICTTKVLNRSRSTMPLSDGWHHYFDLGSVIDELKLKLTVSSLVELDARGIPTGTRKNFADYATPMAIGPRRLDSCFEVDKDNGRAVTELISDRRQIHLCIWQETGRNKLNYMVIYTPPDRRSIAIEPMSSNVNAFNNGDGLMLLAPRQEYRSRFGILLKK